VVSAVLKERASELEAKLANRIPEQYQPAIKVAIEEVFRESQLESSAAAALVHAELSDGDRSRIEGRLAQELPAAATAFQRTADELSAIDFRLGDLSERKNKAPSEERLQATFKELELASKELGELIQQRKALLEELRGKTWLSVDLVRKLRKLEKKIAGTETSGRVYIRAETLLTVLDDLTKRISEAKLKVLRGYFVEAFQRLARKEDMVSDVSIDQETFAVSLIDKVGRVIPKKRLSAGEKQIYAIAMLEALGKTSGRSLPVIIDTPLGRLDSKHRTKLVEQYFPYASHQVIVLSTDTEVDEPFYQGLSKHVSHAYHLEFSPELGMTQESEGYFWKSREEGVVRAA
jgi:DNA sulfur modification protein DndD